MSTSGVKEADRRKAAERLRNAGDGSGAVEDPHPVLDELRARGPVHRGSMASLLGIAPPAADDDTTFSVVAFDEVETVFKDHERFSSDAYETAGGRPGGYLGRTILSMDEPEHRRYRALAQPAFAVKTMQDWEHRWLAPILDRLVAEMPRAGRVDLYNDYCAKFPASTITQGFGIDPADFEKFHVWVLHTSGGGTPEEAFEANQAITDYLVPIIDERRQAQTDDVIGLLAQSTVVDEDGEHRLTDEEVMGFARLMIVAGAGTTYRTMGFLLHQLAGNPEFYARLRADRSLITPVVEETLRWSPPVLYFQRRAVVDSEVGGVVVPAGSFLDVSVTAANHDPKYWDHPHEWDPDRPLRPHAAFGFGPHYCIGNQLARMEIRVALERVLDRYESVRIDPDEPEPVIRGVLFRYLEALPVVVG